MPLWLEKMLGMISVVLNLLRLVLWPHMWSALTCDLYSMCTWKNSVFCSFWMKCSINVLLSQSYPMWCSRPHFLNFLTGLSATDGGRVWTAHFTSAITALHTWLLLWWAHGYILLYLFGLTHLKPCSVLLCLFLHFLFIKSILTEVSIAAPAFFSFLPA